MTSLVIATRNVHKTREFAEMLGENFCVTDLTMFPQIKPAQEDGATFEANARIKALSVSAQLPGLVLADDSGLEVDSLGGAPGIFSARYAGANASDEANRQKLLDELARLPPETPHTARFCCVLALGRKGEVLAIFEGAVEGEIVRQARGSGGFGYDPLFRPHGFTNTFAEMLAEQKNAISHRGLAMVRLRAFLKGQI